MSVEENKNTEAHTDVYYFNVDLKFVLKARMHRLRKTFEDKIEEDHATLGNKYMCYQCNVGTQYTLVMANAHGMKCKNCKAELEEVKEKNKLNKQD